MSQENMEIVRAATALAQSPEGVALLANGDFDFAVLDPEIEWDASGLGDVVPDLAEVYWGREGVRTYWRRWLEAWRDLEFEVQDVLDAGDDVVHSKDVEGAPWSRRVEWWAAPRDDGTQLASIPSCRHK